MNPIKKIESIFQGIDEFETPDGHFRVESRGANVYDIRQLDDRAWMQVGIVRARSPWQALSKWMKGNDE